MTATTETRQGKTLILGVGNVLMGDDGAGIWVVEELRKHILPANVIVDEAGLPGLGLPAWLEGWSSVMIVDAIEMGLPAGTIRCFQPQEVRLLAQEGALSLHQPDLASGLALTQALGMLPEKIVFYGIQPSQTDPGQGLSKIVQDALPEITNRLLEDVRRLE